MSMDGVTSLSLVLMDILLLLVITIVCINDVYHHSLYIRIMIVCALRLCDESEHLSTIILRVRGRGVT